MGLITERTKRQAGLSSERTTDQPEREREEEREGGRAGGREGEGRQL